MGETRRTLTSAPECPALDALLAKARALTTRRENIILDEDDAREALELLAESSEVVSACLAELDRLRAEIAEANRILDPHVSDSERAYAALSRLGIGCAPSLEPGADRRRDALARDFAAARFSGLPHISRAVVGVLAERRRQIEVEGYTPAHDDAHDKGELAGAAAAYAAYRSQAAPEIIMGDEIIATLWPWPGEGSYKPKGRHRDLERACTLLIAEIERLDRLAERTAEEA